MDRNRRHAQYGRATLILCAVAGACAGRPSSPSERCADVLQSAYPYAEVAFTSKTSEVDTTIDLNTIIARVQGTLTHAPRGVLSSVAVECRFHNAIMTDFHWTTGPEE